MAVALESTVTPENLLHGAATHNTVRVLQRAIAIRKRTEMIL
jgi:hypothetical protein